MNQEFLRPRLVGRRFDEHTLPLDILKFLLSVDDGNRVSAEASWQCFIINPACKSVGVQALSQAECTAQELTAIEDGTPHPEHCPVDFTAFDKKAIEKKSKLLRAHTLYGRRRVPAHGVPDFGAGNL